MYIICPQCSLAIRSTTEYHCGDCSCCAKFSANLRGAASTHPAEVNDAIRAIQAILQADEERVIFYNDPDAPATITDRLKAGRWRRVFVHKTSDMWSLQ